MVNIEGLLGKVANNGATLLGILAHGDWNTLVQAVRELQQLAASDERLNTMNEKITAVQELVREIQREQEENFDSIEADNLLHHMIRFAGIVRGVTVMPIGLSGVAHTWRNVFYDELNCQFVLKYGNNYYNAWDNLVTWANYDGTPYLEKLYSTADKLYKADTENDILVEVGESRFSEVENKVYDLIEGMESLLSAIEAHSKDIENILADNQAHHTEHFDGILNEVVKIETIGLAEPTGPYPLGRVLYSAPLRCFVLLFQFKYYMSWWDDARWNDMNTGTPYDKKMYVYDGRIYMYDASKAKLEQAGTNIVALTADEYALLESTGNIDDDLFYAIYEDE